MVPFSLDIRSLSVMVTGVCVMLSITMALIWMTRKTYPGFGSWTAGTAASAAGFLLISLRGMVPPLFTIVLANVCLIIAAALFLEGTRRFRGVSGHRLLSLAAVIGYALVIAYFTYGDNDVAMRIILLSLITAPFYGLCAWELLANAPPDQRFSYLFTGSLFGLYGLFLLTRALLTALDPGPHDLYAPSIMQVATFLISVLLGVAWNFGFLMLNSERLEIDLKSAQVELRRLATTDYLTGIANNRCFFDQGEREIQRARRYGHPLSLLMFDIDLFKKINDTYGHAAGDQVLVSITSRCKNLLRDIDVFGRVGGDEFAILLPETDLAGGKATAERLRLAVAEREIEAGAEVGRVTISIGVSQLAAEDRRVEEMLTRADDAMYAVKRRGGNAVTVLWSRPADPPA
ncbi:MAG: GGDEF domain-containing protein [Syntrophales bacterium]